MTDSYDLIVLGAGSTGENVADYAHRGGLSVVVAEAELVGGECSYWACMPSKALLRPGAALAAARAVDGARQAADGPLDTAAVFARRDRIAGAVTDPDRDASQVCWLDGAGIDLVRGHARITGPRTVSVAGRTLTARRAVAVCTGSEPVIPAIPGLAQARPWTNREAVSAQSRPGRLAIIGAGVVGCEMANAYAWLGSEVTILGPGDRVLARAEEFASELVADGLRAAGATLRLRTKVTAVHRDASGSVVVSVSSGEPITADEVLVATGRRPCTATLGLDSVGGPTDGPLRTDDTGLVQGVDGDWLYAAGDVTGRAPLTHQGKYAARAAGSAIARRAAGETVTVACYDRSSATADHTAIPQVVFTDPELASVGPTLAEAGENARAVDVDFSAVAGTSVHRDSYAGKARLVIADGRVLGATFCGPDVAELLHSATIAIVGQVPVERLWHAVPAYPTISEVWLRLLDKVLG